MAKTKLLAKIEADANLIYTECEKVQQFLDKGTKEGDQAAWLAFAAAQTAESSLDASIRAMRDHMKKWDGSTSLKNIFKSKKELSQKRADAIQKFDFLGQKAKVVKEVFAAVKADFISFKPK